MVAQSLVGRWRLSSYVARDEDGSVRYPFGEHPNGTLIYTPGGWMAAQVGAERRPRLGIEDPFRAGDEERATAFSTYLAYSGSYDVTDGVVLHRVAMCSLPNWVGTVQTRHFDMTGDELVLRTPEMEFGGKQAVHELRWIREEGQGWD
jgi:Lipocalin-like domain